MVTATYAGAQTERRGGAGPVRGLLGGKDLTGRLRLPLPESGDKGQKCRTLLRVSRLWLISHSSGGETLPGGPRRSEEDALVVGAQGRAADRVSVPLEGQGFSWIRLASQTSNVPSPL